jgi:hypothetical protein
MQAPPAGSEIENPVSPFEQAIAPNAKPLPDGIIALLSVSAVALVPMLDTVIDCVPDAAPKPRLFVEKNTTGATTLISGVTVSKSFTAIVSVS